MKTKVEKSRAKKMAEKQEAVLMVKSAIKAGPGIQPVRPPKT